MSSYLHEKVTFLYATDRIVQFIFSLITSFRKLYRMHIPSSSGWNIALIGCGELKLTWSGRVLLGILSNEQEEAVRTTESRIGNFTAEIYFVVIKLTSFDKWKYKLVARRLKILRIMVVTFYSNFSFSLRSKLIRLTSMLCLSVCGIESAPDFSSNSVWETVQIFSHNAS
jgi:hypothetical protein